ncbi:MAG TPA: right-handed parallel beta-helix repeat-containing protein [Phycisphaerae bacterium]|nr:right-handed parallel beta-helix repeat-containing protein [Phycisphaerae bacterium]HRY71259.1 right-handed parallel beta-helix repeat-containing protein [Phycisphaerae bacterium]HSA29661.1 right-handed parallel beta-helix repeat-containing protein [Phycisphaerae bacterium]
MNSGKWLRLAGTGAVLMWAALAGKPAWAGIVHVSTTGDDAHDGASWSLAKRTVRAGLSTARAGDEVWVAAGTYVERITLKAGVGLYGGFAGVERARFQRNWATNRTILDGNERGPVVGSTSGATASTCIDGFTIRNGRGGAGTGVGIYCSNGSPRISNNTIVGNTATATASSGHGGGISCNYASPIIEHNTITANSVSGSPGLGGGIYSSGGSPTIANNTIVGNSATGTPPSGLGLGGAIYCSGGSPTIAHNTIAGNSASGGGAIYCESSSSTISHNTIAANSAGDGGGILCVYSAPTIVNTIVAFNSSGIRNPLGAPTLRHNCVFGNAAYNYSGVSDPMEKDGNISVDPKLVSLAYGNMRIQPSSPCVGAADDGGDVGAYEAGGTVWPEGPYAIVRVSPAGDDARDGSSWAMAKRTIQAAIDAAFALGGEVWVQAGTYYERITLQPFAHVYGGFSGGENARDERDWAANVTILDGQQGGSVVTALAGYRVTTIDGFTIRNGSSASGGGIYCEFSSSTISNNTITENRATGADPPGSGGGIYSSGGSPTITNNMITGNLASNGGGICCSGGSPMIVSNTITANSAIGTASSNFGGGGIYCDSSSPVIVNNRITANNASPGGAGIYCRSSSPTIADNTIAWNNATGTPSSGSTGGGIYCESSSPIILDNTIAGNGAVGAYPSRFGFGGGVCCSGGSPTIANNTITGNAAVGTYSSGCGGGVYCGSSSARISNNMVTGNSATSSYPPGGGGGGIFCLGAGSVIVNNTITANTANNGDGGGISCDDFTAITNTIVAFNSSGVYCGNGASLRHNCTFSNMAYDHFGVTDPTGNNGNISGDPLFVRNSDPGPDGTWGTSDDDYGDLRLRAGSPCIDAGDNVTAVTDEVFADLDSHGRFFDDPATVDTGLGTAPIVDMGAYEYIPGDFDRDSDIDADDLTAFAGCASGPAIPYANDCAGADFDEDGDVDQSDFGMLQRCYSEKDKPVSPSCVQQSATITR